MPSPRFTWDEDAGQFRGAGGQFVGGLQIRGALDDYLYQKEVWARDWADKLARREISISDWQRGMEKEIVNVHLNAQALARGGAAQLSDADLRSASAFIKGELGYLNTLATNVELGLPLDGHFRRRSGQYMQAARASYHHANREEQEKRGKNEERSIRHARDSCGECIFWESVGWQPSGTVSVPGERECHRGCKCTLEYRVAVARLEETREQQNPYDVPVPAADMTPEAIRRDVIRVRDYIAKNYDLSDVQRRWNGKIIIDTAYNLSASGAMTADGTLKLSIEAMAMKNARWSTISHELFHDLEPPAFDYLTYHGWIEGTLELNMRQFRSAMDKSLGLGLSVEANQWRDGGHPYQRYVRVLVGLHQAMRPTGGTIEEFADALFSVPARERANKLRELAQGLPPKRRKYCEKVLLSAEADLGREK